ncbi:hypothetical protein WN944_010928 [Citrus x changshan-huyou]|uniref:Uncharacterized protein n=1 Tax=Citrus x changshan-huyou TaxID=2935761 RepID=A0AAP0QXI9_9ROSI
MYTKLVIRYRYDWLLLPSYGLFNGRNVTQTLSFPISIFSTLRVLLRICAETFSCSTLKLEFQPCCPLKVKVSRFSVKTHVHIVNLSRLQNWKYHEMDLLNKDSLEMESKLKVVWDRK